MPTFAEFREKLCKELGCKYLKLDGEIKDPSGNAQSIYYFEREAEGEVFRIVAPDLKDTDHVIYSTTRSICNALRIHPKVFGLNLG